MLAVRIRIHHCEQCRPALHSQAKIKAAAQPAIPHPLQRLLIAESLLGLSDGRAPNPAQDEFMPELIQLAQLFVFPAPFTSPMTRINSITSP